MNYIQEELLRQRELLAVLMRGGGRKDADGEQRRADGAMEPSSGEFSQYKALEEAGGRPGTADGAGWLREDRARALPDAGFEDGEGPWGRAGDGTGAEPFRSMAEDRSAPVRPRAAAGSGRVPALSRALDGTGPMMEGEERRGRTRFAGEGVSDADWDIRSVSRGIQRDARRYDGGFSMY